MNKILLRIEKEKIDSIQFYQQFVLVEQNCQEWAEFNIEDYKRLKSFLVGKSILKIKQKNIAVLSSVNMKDKEIIVNMIKAYGELFNIEVETEFILNQY